MTAALLTALIPALLAAGPDLAGRVALPSGAPAAGALILIESAAYREGDPADDPEFPDCRRRARADAEGRFRIEGVDPALVFRVRAFADGCRPGSVDRVDPARGPIAVDLAAFDPAEVPADRMIRGVVLDPDGRPLAGARVAPARVEAEGLLGLDFRLTDRMAFTDGRGEFTWTARPRIDEADLRIEGDGVAPQVVLRLAPGRGFHRLAMARGSTLTGRVARDGRPVAGAVVGLVQAGRDRIAFPGDDRATADGDGRFTFSHVAADEDHFVYAIMGGLGPGGGTVPARPVRSARDGATLDVGTLAVVPGHRLRGRVILPDGEPIPAGARLTAALEDARDRQVARVDAEGRFALDGLAAGRYGIHIPLAGYRVSPRNHSADPGAPWRLIGDVDVDLLGLTVLMEREGPPAAGLFFTGQTIVGPATPPPPPRRYPPPER